MQVLFSITVDCDAAGNINVWSQQKEKLSSESLEKLVRMMQSVKRAVNQNPIRNELFSTESSKARTGEKT